MAGAVRAEGAGGSGRGAVRAVRDRAGDDLFAGQGARAGAAAGAGGGGRAPAGFARRARRPCA